MSNYPPGVSGNEDAFGPQSEDEVTVTVTCPSCDEDVTVSALRLTWNYSVEDIFDCPSCGAEEVSVEVFEEPDYPDDPSEVFDFYGEEY